ncbi:vesicular glutamate transporter 1 [Plakobranchus ocellatus]|uniref:Vesicular glutamate transporter 1 n=1 Tax=Plakobranchus ocellatus TaxID=259542 RepID=A0AAV4AE88_9GAST|nr:vesicular glutamate transporter 1 [Plakobranchus ocellatus]
MHGLVQVSCPSGVGSQYELCRNALNPTMNKNPRYGGRKLMTVCLLAGGMSTVLLPKAATAHPALIIVFRVITGVSLSGTDSMIQAMWARWAPKFEKASLSSVGYTGRKTHTGDRAITVKS